MNTTPATTKRRSSPLLYPAAFLSTASLAWTTWSLVDLLGAGLIGLTVAAGADIIWGTVIVAEARGVRVAGRSWVVPAIGWITLLIVAAFLGWHGINEDSWAMAAAGPFLPLGAKIVWAIALADMRDPAALTHDELHTLAAMERGMTFEEAQHRIEMRRRQMDAELLMTEVSTDFNVELMRQDRARELNRRRPLELEAAIRPTADTSEANTNGANALEANANSTTNDHTANVRPTDSEPFASLAADAPLFAQANDTANDANTAGHTTRDANAFGFAAALPDTNTTPRHTANGSPRTANANTEANTNDANKANANSPANDEANSDDANVRQAAANTYRQSVANGHPISGAALGRRYGRTARWGQKLVAELKQP